MTQKFWSFLAVMKGEGNFTFIRHPSVPGNVINYL